MGDGPTFIAKHPLLAGLGALAILLPLTIPLLSLNLGQQDIAALPTSTTARRAYDLMSDNFGAGVNGPLIVAVTLGSPAEPRPRSSAGSSAGSRPTRERSATADARRRTSPRPPAWPAMTPIQIDEAGTTAYFNAIATHRAGRDSDRRTGRAPARERDPGGREGHGHDAHVGGSTAGYVDLAARISRSCRCRSSW